MSPESDRVDPETGGLYHGNPASAPTTTACDWSLTGHGPTRWSTSEHVRLSHVKGDAIREIGPKALFRSHYSHHCPAVVMRRKDPSCPIWYLEKVMLSVQFPPTKKCPHKI